MHKTYSQNQTILLWTNKTQQYITLFDWGNNQQTYIAFTDTENAKDFLREMQKLKMGFEFDRVLPITITEWFSGIIIKDKDFKKHLLAIDPNPDIMHHPDFNEGISDKYEGQDLGNIKYKITTEEVIYPDS